MFGKKKFNNVTINGKTISCSGNNITIRNNQVIIDGKVIQSELASNIEVIINGDVEKIDCDGSVTVHGNAGSVDCGNSCTVSGDVNGDIDAGNSVTCGNVAGDIDAGNSVICRR